MEAREFERIYEQHARTIAAYALRRTRCEQDAEEIVAETFLVAWRRSDELKGDPLPWLYGVARRVHASYARKAGRAPLELREDVAAAPDSSLERAELMGALLRLSRCRRS